MKWARMVSLLPVGKLFDRAFAEGIKPAAEQANIHCAVIEPLFSAPGHLDTICQEIEGADLIVADVTARNPNVMFLAGYAQGIGRDLLLITQHGEDFPFDPAKLPPIIYGGAPIFLKQEILAFLRNKTNAQAPHAGNAREQFMQTFGDLLNKHQYEHRGEIHLENPTTFVLLNQDMDLPLVQDIARRGRELGIRIKLM